MQVHWSWVVPEDAVGVAFCFGKRAPGDLLGKAALFNLLIDCYAHLMNEDLFCHDILVRPAFLNI